MSKRSVQYLSRQEAAEWLQSRGVPAGYAFLARDKGRKIPTYKFGRLVRYAVSDLKAYIKAAKTEGAATDEA